MKVLVTGGAGFIGHHLVHALLASGHVVTVLDDFSTGRRSRLASVRDRIAVVEGSLLTPATLALALRGVDVVLHQAALASVAESLVDPGRTNEVNVGGTLDLVLAAAQAGVGRIVFAGSSAVYGNPTEMPCRESQAPDPQSPYAISKLAAEQYLHSLGRLHGLQTVSLRYFNVFGPGQDPASEYSAVIPKFITAALRGDQPVIFGDPVISRDFVYVDDVVQANVLAMSPDAATGLTCNIASGERTSLGQLVSAIGDALGREVTARQGPERMGDVLHSQGDIALAERELGYHVRVPFADGIARTLAWYGEHTVPSR